MAKNMIRRPFPRGGISTRLPVTIYRRATNQLHPEAQDWIDRVVANGGTVSTATAGAVDTFCAAIASAGIRDRFLRLNLFCGTGLNACLVPLYRAASLGDTQLGNATDTNNNFMSGDYGESTGLWYGGVAINTNKRLDTGLNGSELSAGNRHVAAYEIANSGSDYSPSVLAGNANATMHGIGPWTASGTYAYRTHNTVGGNTTIAKNNGFLLGNDTSTTASTLYRNGSVGNTATGQPAGGSASTTYQILGHQSGEWSEARLGGYSIGLSMTGPQVAAYYTAMQAFQTSLTRNV